MTRHRSPWLRTVLLVSVLALVAAACGGDGDDGATPDGDGDGLSGEAVLFTAFTEQADVDGVEAVIAAFNEQHPNATVTHEGSPSFEEQALTRVEGGNPPDMMFHPQPGLLDDFVDRGAAQPLDFLDTAQLEDEYVSGLLDLGTFDDELYGLMVRLTFKSATWYPLPAFEDAGYEPPATWQEMLDLSGEIADTETTPWCIGVESGTATGWPFTDWVEDVMLRLHGPEVYDQWTAGELGFTSDEVRAAFEEVGNIWFEEGWVLGGRANIVQTSFQAAPLPMFEDPPACFLHRQASFAQQLFPEETEYGTDYDFFYFPEMEDGAGKGVLTAGDLIALYTDNEVAQAFIEFIGTAEAQEAWAEQGNMLCSNTGCDTSVYPNEASVKMSETLNEADFARFDGSDLMPGQVGSGTFWSESVQWIAGQQDLDTTLQNIENSWPEGE